MASSQYQLPRDTPVVSLDCQQAFSKLTEKEKRYAYELGRGSWFGGLIDLFQCSFESPPLFVLFQTIFRNKTLSELEVAALSAGISKDHFLDFSVFAAAVYHNLGNYKSFGDTKFVPACPKAEFAKILAAAGLPEADQRRVDDIWEKVGERTYCLAERSRQFGFNPTGVTGYHSADVTNEEAVVAQAFLTANDISAYNTRLVKLGDKKFNVRLASADTEASSEIGDGDLRRLGEYKFSYEGSDYVFEVTRGDFSSLMEPLVQHLSQAREFVANENQSNMLAEYARSFKTGSVEAHVEGSRVWIRDLGPAVESYIGFIESYRDPFGTRGEFEGFVAAVNREMSAKFGKLVEQAEDFLLQLPWGPDFEKAKFLKPDFTSLDVITFASGGVPAGINIPNYDEVRQNDGFKNVSLGNVLAASYTITKNQATFLEESVRELFVKYGRESFELQVGLHELLGHGSGRLFRLAEDGTKNFRDGCTNPLTGKPTSGFYSPGETYESKFSKLHSAYEECRAECVGLYLCYKKAVWTIFGYDETVGNDVAFANWLNEIRAGLLGLEYYSPASKTWGQAHMHARHAILRVCLEAGDDFVTVEQITGEDGAPDLLLKVDRSKVATVGMKAMGDFLTKIQVYKSTGDVAAAEEMFHHYTDVPTDSRFATYRDIVVARKLPRKLLVQPNVQLTDGAAVLRCHDATLAGMTDSFVTRFGRDVDEKLLQLWSAETPFAADV